MPEMECRMRIFMEIFGLLIVSAALTAIITLGAIRHPEAPAESAAMFALGIGAGIVIGTECGEGR